ncbi:hypothetical protein HJFPF1_11516 [Paramyrothecium foliicola]|nr:hypothetical protein HJFPF1_11516 [Paramyrothecium foliicola]
MSDPTKQLIENSIAANKALVATLAETDYAPPALEQQKRLLAELKAELDRSTKNIPWLKHKQACELRDHEGYRDSHFKKFLFKATKRSDKFAERAEKEEREYFEALQKLHNEEKLSENLKARIPEIEAVLPELEEKARINKDAQRRLDDLYFSIFTGPTPQFPGDDERETRSNQALQAYHDARVRVEADDQVLEIMSEVWNNLKRSLGHMEEALDASRLDMFGGGTMADLMERNALSSSERQITQAQMLVLRAQRISNHVEDFPRFRFVEHSMLGDIVFDNIFSDMEFHDKLKEGRLEVQRLVVWGQEQVKKATDKKNVSAQQLRQREAELESARKDLQKFREGIFEKVASGQVP